MVGKDSFAVDDSWMTRKIDIYWDKSFENSFNDFNSSNQKIIIEQINKISENKRKEFGSATPQIEIGDWEEKVIYKFDSSDNTYKEQKKQSWSNGN
jgi:hypothetical protein